SLRPRAGPGWSFRPPSRSQPGCVAARSWRFAGATSRRTSRWRTCGTLQPTERGLRFERPKTRRSARSVVLPGFLRPYLLRQRSDQERRRGELGGAWSDEDLVVDAGDGSPLNPGTLSAGWVRFLGK